MGQCLNGYAESLGLESHIDQKQPLSIRVDDTELQLFSLLSQFGYIERCFLSLKQKSSEVPLTESFCSVF